MSVNFTIAKQFTKDLEGGYWNDPSAGHTYAGITYKYYPNWKGWPLLFQLAAKRFGSIANTPRYTKFKSPELDALIADFYKTNFWDKKLNGSLFRNQDIVNFTYDFIVHKENDAIAVINHTAKILQPNVTTNKTSVSKAVIDTANSNQQKFYEVLRNNRVLYYRNPRSIPGTGSRKFSAGLVKAFIRDRVNRFPLTTIPQLLRPLFSSPFNLFRS